jgi:serine/threonine protein kinase
LIEDELKDVFSQILGALSYLHKHNICHRDIKPDNILYDKENKQVKIIDFGVSKNVKLRGRCEKMLTDTGTFYYKAPEMFTGEGYTEAVDSWAVGILLYEMITG